MPRHAIYKRTQPKSSTQDAAPVSDIISFGDRGNHWLMSAAEKLRAIGRGFLIAAGDYAQEWQQTVDKQSAPTTTPVTEQPAPRRAHYPPDLSKPESIHIIAVAGAIVDGALAEMAYRAGGLPLVEHVVDNPENIRTLPDSVQHQLVTAHNEIYPDDPIAVMRAPESNT